MPKKGLWHIIKNKLESLNLAVDESDWQLMAEKLDSPVDQNIRAKLLLHQENFEPDDWDLFLDYAEKASLEEKDILLDQKIKKKLDDFVIPLEENAWMMFQDALPKIKDCPETKEFNPVPIRLMEVPVMDAIIRKKLAGLSLSPAYTDWFDMLELLEQDFDHTVYHSLNKLEVNNRATDWKKMSLLLDQISRPVRSFPWMRAAAAAVFFFCLLIGGNFWVFKNDLPVNFNAWMKKSSSTPTLLAPEPSKTLASKKGPATKPLDPVEEKVQTVDQLESSVIVKAALAHSAQASKQETSIGSWDASHAPPIELVKDESLHLDSYQTTANKNAKDNQKAGSLERQMNQLRNNYRVNKMGVMAVNELWEMNENEKPWLPSVGKKKRDLWIGVYGATAQTKVELNGPKSETPGYTAGLRAMIQLNEHWSFVSGLAYGKKEFNYAYSLYSDSLAIQGSLTVVDVPLLLRYEFETDNELGLYLQAGAVATLSLNENYLEFDPNTPQNGGIRRLSPYGNEPTNFEQKLNSYPGNILLSFGVAYPIGDKYRVELEPYFLQNLQRIVGVERLGLKKRLYTAGIGLNFYLNTSPSK
ncbi:MAG: PorT family protein [Bacteroidia bacterium]|nr:PorT family protein [Bacteroidia bacterium]